MTDEKKTPEDEKAAAFRRIMRDLTNLPANDREAIIRSLVVFFDVKAIQS